MKYRTIRSKFNQGHPLTTRQNVSDLTQRPSQAVDLNMTSGNFNVKLPQIGANPIFK